METNMPFTIEVRQLEDNPFQPRKAVSPTEVVELANSIRDVGLLQPITVRRVGDRWQIIAGHRRVAAYRLLADSAADEETKRKYSSIRAEVRNEVSNAESLRLCLTENLQRNNLKPLEAAEGISKLKEMNSQLSDYRSLGAAVGISHTQAGRLLRLASAPEYLKSIVDDGADSGDDEARSGQRPSKLSASAVLELIRAHDSLASIPGVRSPKSFAQARLRPIIKRALERQWSVQKLQTVIDELVGKNRAVDKVPEAPSTVPTTSPEEAATKINANTGARASEPSSSRATIAAPVGATPVANPAKTPRNSIELAWEVLVLGVVVSIAGGFFPQTIISQVITWVGTAISLSGVAMLVRFWAPLQRAWTKAFEQGLAPLWREITRAHSQPHELPQSPKKTPWRGKKAA